MSDFDFRIQRILLLFNIKLGHPVFLINYIRNHLNSLHVYSEVESSADWWNRLINLISKLG